MTDPKEAGSEKARELLQKEIAPDETLIWTGEPDARYHLRGTWTNFALGLPWTLGSLWAALLFAREFGAGQFLSFLPLALFLSFAAFGGMLMYQPLGRSRSRPDNLFAITSRRVIVIQPDRGLKLIEFPLDQVQIQRRELPDGGGDLIIGKHVHDHWREPYLEEIAFTSLPEPKAVETILRETIANSKS